MRHLRLLTSLALLGMPLARGVGAQATRHLPVGVYVVTLVNEQRLPVSDRLPTVSGKEQAVRLEEGTLRLGADGRFVAAVRYHRALVDAGSGMPATPVLDDAQRGRFVVHGSALTLIPDAPEHGRAPEPFTATMRGRGRLTLPMVYRDGQYARRYLLELRYDPTRW